MEFKTWLNTKIKKTEKYLEIYLPEKDNRQKKIYESMRYSLFAGGKRIRPVLMMETFSMFNEDEDSIMPFACALEMIHTYSLIHDDLPAMDDDDYRRGKPTNHKVYGDAMAILAGDGLLNKAFETVSQNMTSMKIPAERILKSLEILSTASGTEGMIGGQVTDMFVEERTMEYLEYMHKLKTGALIRAACEIGATAGGATEEEISKLSDYARYLGLAFQVKDDILDFTADEEELGKPVGSDEKNAKLTYITLVGLEESQRILEDYTEKAVASLGIFGDRADRLREIAEYLLIRKN
ncbi:farnesyl-diphosphate synthase [Dethiosulfatibacter aminovorans DSM 17477]|uniref:Farnesyl diphosphate synthase n=1 Tax=Dethiosulfatibacter aminovorans DSM 17477 TaxID=1121476 RepID=A0A1M6J0D3_9FIRM|nr:farnesyl diphosphate synthase [Dethiosulfatibacter aminovorans]SHJ40092.1 farnesyl-diphosphate synthase [Dethiosulfatibacter aminovorans DSM 17477]